MGLFDKILGRAAPRVPTPKLDEIREIYESGKWRRALTELEAFPVEVLLADAASLGLWLHLRANLARSAILPRLTSPDLSMSCLTDEGAAAIAGHRSAFAHLETLDLSDNALTADGAALVEGVCREVKTGAQAPDRVDGDRRYVPVGE